MSTGWYVTAINITKWAENHPRDAQEILPLLIKRLIFASANASTIRFPSGDSIVLTGWDGILKTDKGNAFIPTGDSAWEVSTEKTVVTKANSDYIKRTQNPGAVDKKKATFVFVTSQQWSGLADWVSEKKSEGQWADVKALSSQELSDWLLQCPAVHQWFARLIGNRPEGAWDAEEAWAGWSLVTQPQCSTNIVIAGRTEQSEELSNLLSQSPEIIEVSSENKDEAYAFILASVKTHPWLLPRLLIVKDPKEWDLLIQSPHSLFLIPLFDPLPTLELAVKNGHWVLLPALSQFSRNAKLALERPSKDQRLKALIEMGVTAEDAEDIVNESKNRLHILRRHHKLVKVNHQKPDWANSVDAEPIIAALLAGSWLSDNSFDCEKLSYLAGIPYKLEQTLNKWLITGDFPVEHQGNKWQVVSAIDSWEFLNPFITQPILDRFGKVAIEVLNENDPRLELPPEERWLAVIHKKVTKYSADLRHGLSQGLAILGSLGDRDCVNVTTDPIQAMVSYWLMQLLNDEMSATQWGSLAPELALFAEASPEVFLNAVENGLGGQDPPVMSLFVDEGPMGGCPHLGLLRGLECIAWDLNYTSRVVSILAKLALSDPGGKWANRPYNTLKDIFRGWLPQTKASLEKRLEILDSLITYNSAFGWKLLVDLLPEEHEISTPIGIPHFRDWAKGWEKGVTNSEYHQHVRSISERILIQISKDPEKAWLSVERILSTLPEPYLGRAIDQLDKDLSALSDSTKAILYKELQNIISHHTQYSDCSWALRKESIERLCAIHQKLIPEDLTVRYKILFDNYFAPITNVLTSSEYEENERRGEKARSTAIEEIWKKAGIAGIERLIDSVQYPGIVGNSLSTTSFSEEIEPSLFSWLESANVNKQQAVSSYIRSKAFNGKAKWLDTVYDKYLISWPEQVWVNFCRGLPFNKALFDFLEKFKEPIKTSYWKTVQMCYLSKEDARYAPWVLERLIANNRPFLAIDAAASYLQTIPQDSEISNDLLLRILEQTLANPEDIKSIRRDMLGYDLKVILKIISDDEKIDQSRLAKIEWFYMPIFRDGELHPKVLTSEVLKNPEFFVDLICLMFKAHPPIENEFSGIPLEVLNSRALSAHHLIETINSIPGQKDTSDIDLHDLDSWVKQVRERCAKKNRKDIGDQVIGQILSHSPIGKDTIWPHEAVRDILERYCSANIEKGLECGRFNQRGVITKSLTEGGEQERKIAAGYSAQAEQIRFKYPRTSNMLKRMADTYIRQAIREDRDKELK